MEILRLSLSDELQELCIKTRLKAVYINFFSWFDWFIIVYR
jgi:hypothetical protein